MTIEDEIKDLQLFSYALRQDNRLLFERMMSELEPEVLMKAGLAKDPFEVIAMALILKQQEMIRQMMEKIKEGD